MPLAAQLTRTAMLATTPAPDVAPLRRAIYRALRAAGWSPAPPLRAASSRRVETDEALLRAFVEHSDPEAFEALCDRHLPKLVGYARRYLQPADADDVVQDAFLVLLRKATDLLATAERGDAGGFLFGVVRTLVRKRLAHCGPEIAAPDPLDAAPTDEDDALTQLLRREDDQRLIAAMEATLSPLEQDVLLLAFEGHGGPAIAEQLEISEANARVLKHRALQKLRAALAKEAT